MKHHVLIQSNFTVTVLCLQFTAAFSCSTLSTSHRILRGISWYLLKRNPAFFSAFILLPVKVWSISGRAYAKASGVG